MPLTLTSPAFAHGESIPQRHTCEGEDTAPALEWSGVPDGTRSLALIVDDPDAPDPEHPKTTFVHWVLYNLPATAGGLVEGVEAEDLPVGAIEGLNDWKRAGYGGPCPPIGRHRYFFKLYALNAMLSDQGTITKPELELAMRDHIVAQVELIGTYQKSQP